MADKTIIMAWSKCTYKVGATGEGDAFNKNVTEIGKVKDKSSSLEASDGDALEMRATGGELVASEISEGSFMFKTRIIEPTDDLYTKLGLGAAGSGEYNVKTHIVSTPMSFEITPKNIGATGIRVPKSTMKVKPGYSEDEGHYLDIEHDVLMGATGVWYSRFKNGAGEKSKSK